MKTVLTIAGFDPSSGAGITADLMVFAAHGLFGTSCITAITVQNTFGVETTEAVATDTVSRTLDCLHRDLPPAGIKIGMLANAGTVSAVAAYIREIDPQTRPLIVLDPVLKSSDGKHLVAPDAIEVLRRDLLPEVNWITPNHDELQLLLGKTQGTDVSIPSAATELQQFGRALAVVVTGGDQAPPVDFLLDHQSNQQFIPGKHIATTSTHGTGCAFSSALLSRLVLGDTAIEAVRAAKSYVAEAMRSAAPIGGGYGPLNHLWPLRKADTNAT